MKLQCFLKDINVFQCVLKDINVCLMCLNIFIINFIVFQNKLMYFRDIPKHVEGVFMYINVFQCISMYCVYILYYLLVVGWN
jgi:hypothetical protein